ncbi:TetR family transcriptional regulator C-terminal domain-containing protein [Streptomyces mutabilis]|uniref:TetR family transcriptional regulator C-terminal domain-containing protein n=1 Tax=Streptomyces mutabilis TaxID=67332 RepID=UPI0037AA0AEF
MPQGCLVGNTTAELVPQDTEATEIVARSYSRFTEIVTAALERAQATGEVTDKAPPEAQAHMPSIWSRVSRSSRGRGSTGPRPWRRSTPRWTGCGPDRNSRQRGPALSARRSRGRRAGGPRPCCR